MKLCLICHLQFADYQETCPKDCSSLVPLGQDPLIGRTIQERYKVESVIGRGSMGVVYRGNQEIIGRAIAIKVLHGFLVNDPEAIRRFRQEAKAASRLCHPHIITVYDYGVMAGNQPYIVMELLEGASLSKILETRGHLPLHEALAIFKQVCEALSDAHKHGVIHRDIKPDNIVLESSRGQDWAIVVDFGISKLIQTTDETLTKVTQTGEICGSPAYMSPEQFRGKEIDQRSDIYSLAAVIFETLTGQMPYPAQDLISLMTMHLSDPPPRLSQTRGISFPARFEKCLTRALSKDPADRPQSMSEFWEELHQACQQTDQPEPGVKPPIVPGKRHMTSLSNQRCAPATKEPAISEATSDRKSRLTDPSHTSQAARAPNHRHGPELPRWLHLVGTFQSLFPYVLTLILSCSLWWTLKDNRQASNWIADQVAILLHRPGNDPAAESSAPSGRVYQTIRTLERKVADRSATPADRELIDSLYLRLSGERARTKNYQEAIFFAEKIPPRSTLYRKSRSYIELYRQRLKDQGRITVPHRSG